MIRSYSLKTGIKEKSKKEKTREPPVQPAKPRTELVRPVQKRFVKISQFTTQSIWEKLRSQPCYPRISDDLRLHPLPPCTSSGEPESELGVFFHTFLFSLTRLFQTLTMGGVACFLAFLWGHHRSTYMRSRHGRSGHRSELGLSSFNHWRKSKLWSKQRQ